MQRCGRLPGTPSTRLRRHSRHRIRAALAVIALLGVSSSAVAQAAQGGFCQVAQRRLDGTSGKMKTETLWTYNGDKAPFHPVFGWVDLECWNTAGAVKVDIAKRAWFGIAGPADAPVSDATIQFSNPHTRAGSSSTGVTADGMSLMGHASPGHDCVFEVHVWAESCPSR